MNDKYLFQHGTLGALMAGLMEGNEKISTLLQHGDLGIGTLDGLDGEVIILDKHAYQAKSNGALVELSGEELTPYAAVTMFNVDNSFPVDKMMTSKELKEKVVTYLKSQNLFAAVKISGTFKKMHVRVMPKQFPPFKKLVDVSKVQPEFERTEIKGTIVGFYTPTLFQGMSAAGFHLHFLSDSHDFGGHILDFDMSEGIVEISNIETLQQHFPINDATFLSTKIDYSNVAAEIEEAES
ncbi:acetolactate decarboxylase [Vagococcus vulneris]|uniref:Alpha-acetolactate decarboxylase n=1 Tax=Vagococcus vulneris TaxID=1977869 RepID=A0A429ZWG8_9ENTE|nr:acetolactate decarboxylase [Vagococcus vulneris]RST98060.1 acetolactate decarboxylase [Vagococcus vulneris]